MLFSILTVYLFSASPPPLYFPTSPFLVNAPFGHFQALLSNPMRYFTFFAQLALIKILTV